MVGKRFGEGGQVNTVFDILFFFNSNVKFDSILTLTFRDKR